MAYSVNRYRIEPQMLKRFLRFTGNPAGVSNFFAASADHVLQDITNNNEQWTIQVVFRMWHKTGGGPQWHDLVAKWGGGDPGYGYRLQINDSQGTVRLVTRDTVNTWGIHESTVGGLNDGKIYNLFMFQDRAAYTYFYVGEVGGGDNSVTRLGDRIATVQGSSLNNDGAFQISDDGAGAPSTEDHRPFYGDIFLVRLFREDSSLSGWYNSLNGDITRRVDTFDIYDLEYTSDPSTQPGCVCEYVLDSPAADEWDRLVDTSGNDLHLYEQSGAYDMRCCWGNERIRYNSQQIDPSWHMSDRNINKSGEIVSNIGRDGGYDPAGNKIDDKRMRMVAVYQRDTVYDHDYYKSPDVQVMNIPNSAIYDTDRDWFHRFSTIKSWSDTEEELYKQLTRVNVDLICPDPFWYKEFKIADTPGVDNTYEHLLDSGNSYQVDIKIDNDGNVDTYPRFMFVSYGSPNGYIVVENLSTGESFSLGLVTIGTAYEDLLWEMSNEDGDDDGKALYVDCNDGSVYAGDYYESKHTFFNGSFMKLIPGHNRIRVTGGLIGGNQDEIGVFMEYWEKQLV